MSVRREAIERFMHRGCLPLSGIEQSLFRSADRLFVCVVEQGAIRSADLVDESIEHSDVLGIAVECVVVEDAGALPFPAARMGVLGLDFGREQRRFSSTYRLAILPAASSGTINPAYPNAALVLYFGSSRLTNAPGSPISSMYASSTPQIMERASDIGASCPHNAETRAGARVSRIDAGGTIASLAIE